MGIVEPMSKELRPTANVLELEKARILRDFFPMFHNVLQVLSSVVEVVSDVRTFFREKPGIRDPRIVRTTPRFVAR